MGGRPATLNDVSLPAVGGGGGGGGEGEDGGGGQEAGKVTVTARAWQCRLLAQREKEMAGGFDAGGDSAWEVTGVMPRRWPPT